MIVDNSIVSFAYHLNNGIPILTWIEDFQDTQVI